MAKFETTDYAQMRRCRMAHLYGRRVDEHFRDETQDVIVSGFIQSIRPELTAWPLRWTVTIEQLAARAPTPAPTPAPVMELAD